MVYEKLSLLRKDEMTTVRKSRREFSKELDFVKQTSELFLKTFEILSNEDAEEASDSKGSTHIISYRIFRILHCAITLSLRGYYDVSMALLRIAYENYLLMNYLSKNEGEAKLWFKGKRFAPVFLRQNVRFFGIDSLYRDMSEFVHSSIKSILSFVKSEMGIPKVTLGEYSHRQFKNVVFLMLTITAISIILLSLTFTEELMKNEQWRSMFSQTVPKMWKHLKRVLKKEVERK